MSDLLLSTLSKVILPTIAIVALLFAARRRKLSLVEDLGFRTPNVIAAAGFFLLWLLLVIAEELLTSSIEGVKPKQWPDYAMYIVVLRIVAIGILGPISEELAFRGFLMAWLKRTRLGVYGAIILTSAIWAAIHIQYVPLLLLLIFVDGLVLGFARHVSRSIYVPIAMHIAGNLFSIWQSLSH